MNEFQGNPYVGPRTFTQQEGNLFFGREREARDLLSTVIAARLVLFYAPSGAGKSSLINTRLIPQLMEEGYVVLPVGRVGGDLPEGVADVDNLFIFNLLLNLDEGDQAPRRFAHMTLSDFLERLTTTDGMHFFYEPPVSSADTASPMARQDADGAHEAAEGAVYEAPPYVLIIDQFEEIVTQHPERWQEREDFFRQLDRAMRDDPKLWVVLTLREDYVATLDPYAPLLTDKLRVRFYMQRMEAEAALQAIVRPAEAFGRPFAPGVAESLVENLRQIRVHGQTRAKTGQFIEPVQLQVVCYQLWENVRDRPSGPITHADLPHGYVDRALTDFYEDTLDEVVRRVGVSERDLRRWFGEQLITPTETRGLALRGREETAGLPNAAVDLLEGRHLIRVEVRGGAPWYELAHDRLVDPVLQSNRAWAAARETPLRAAARRWQETGDTALLYRDAALEQALAQADPADQEPYEAAFLEASQQAERDRTRIRRRRWAISGGAVAAVVLILMAMLTVSAIRGQRRAQEAQALAEANARTIQAERNIAVTARAALEANLEANLTAQAVTSVRDAESAAIAEAPTGTPEDVTTSGADEPPSAEATPMSRADLAATATIEVMQAQLYEVRATQTAAVMPPFTDGVVVSYGGATGDYLLKDPNNEKSGIVWIRVGTKVTLLRQGQGSPSYGSGTWYLVSLVDPETREIREGWLPAEIIKAR
jgi:hypothetical protein